MTPEAVPSPVCCVFAHRAARSTINTLRYLVIFWIASFSNFFFCQWHGKASDWFSHNSDVISFYFSNLTSALVRKPSIFRFSSSGANSWFFLIWLILSDLKDFSTMIGNLVVYFALVSFGWHQFINDRNRSKKFLSSSYDFRLLNPLVFVLKLEQEEKWLFVMDIFKFTCPIFLRRKSICRFLSRLLGAIWSF